MKSQTIFNTFFEFNDTPKPTTTAPISAAKSIIDIIRQRQSEPEVQCEIINGRPRARLNRDQADVIVDLVNTGREIAQNSDKWSQANLDMWDSYWNGNSDNNGIEHTLSSYHSPNITLKQLLWCVNSITKTQTSLAVPAFVKEAVRELRKMEKAAQ